ncbi:MAG: hypothetical protein COA47_14500 [Robiginitomaculum sp.]|nr:MAG: hypothetical protein COA47_14500 [Robiginitomaculum sp.]
MIKVNNEDELCCPSCGSNNIAHKNIDIFDRKEGRKHEFHVSVSEGVVKVDNDLSQNPSGNRGGIKIGFECEGCGEKSLLKITQHKGVTFIKFEK